MDSRNYVTLSKSRVKTPKMKMHRRLPENPVSHIWTSEIPSDSRKIFSKIRPWKFGHDRNSVLIKIRFQKFSYTRNSDPAKNGKISNATKMPSGKILFLPHKLLIFWQTYPIAIFRFCFWRFDSVAMGCDTASCNTTNSNVILFLFRFAKNIFYGFGNAHFLFLKLSASAFFDFSVRNFFCPVFQSGDFFSQQFLSLSKFLNLSL